MWIGAVLNELEPFEVGMYLTMQKIVSKNWIYIDSHMLRTYSFVKTAPNLDWGRFKRTRDIRRFAIISYYVKDVSKNCINIDSISVKTKDVKTF